LYRGSAGEVSTGSAKVIHDSVEAADWIEAVKAAVTGSAECVALSATATFKDVLSPNGNKRFKVGLGSQFSGLGVSSQQQVIAFEDKDVNATDADWNDAYWKVTATEAPAAPPTAQSCSTGPTRGGAGSGGGQRSRCGTGGPGFQPMICFPSTGSLTVGGTDLLSDGGTGWSQSSVWTNNTSQSFTNDASGNGIVQSNLPVLLKAGNVIQVVKDGTNSVWFDASGGSYTGRYFVKDTLVASGSDLVYTDTAGAKLTFYGFSSAATDGKFKSYVAPSGQAVTANYPSGKSQPDYVTSFTSGSVIERFYYDYFPTGNANAGRLQTVTVKRSTDSGTTFNAVRAANYTYYGASDANGNLGDLKTVEISEGGVTTDRRYYRYYVPVTVTGGFKTPPTNGYEGGLKYAFEGDSYDRLVAAYPSFDSATDA